MKPTNPPATSKPTDPPATEKPTEPTPPATYTPNPEVEGETRENPLWLSNDTSHTVTVKPGYTVYLMKLLVEERHMIISGGDFELVINAPENKRAKTIVSENGQTAQTVKPEGIGNTLYLDLTNTTGKEQTYTISFIAPLGSSANPEKLNLGEWKLEIKKGQDKGYEYTFTATKDGVFTLECLSCTKGVIYFLEVNAPDHEADVANVMKQVRIESTDGNSVSVAIRKGDKITIKLGTLQNTSGVRNPKGKFELKATLE